MDLPWHGTQMMRLKRTRGPQYHWYFSWWCIILIEIIHDTNQWWYIFPNTLQLLRLPVASPGISLAVVQPQLRLPSSSWGVSWLLLIRLRAWMAAKSCDCSVSYGGPWVYSWIIIVYEGSFLMVHSWWLAICLIMVYDCYGLTINNDIWWLMRVRL